jgi:hypothetical protein
LPHHFEHVAERILGYETMLFASDEPLAPLLTVLDRRGFTDIAYEVLS